MNDFIKKQLNDFDDKAFIHALKVFIIIAFLVIGYGFIYSGFQIVDEFEHLHASWLVSEGKLPYRDFFEHHHPLLWYISAPLVSVFYDDVSIFYVMRLISAGVSAVTLFFMYRIALFFTDKKGGLLMVAIALCNIITIYNFYQFRPDGWMNLFFIIGVYHLFCYIKKPLIKNIIISFCCFSLSLLFLQKIGLMLGVIEGVLIWLILKKQIKLKQAIIAAIPAVLIVGIFLLSFVKNGTILEYFALNFRFNQALVYYFERGAFWRPNLIFRIYGLGVLFSIYFFRKENIYFKIIAILYIAEFLMRGFYFAPHPNYYTLLIILFALVISVSSKEIMPKYKGISIAVIMGLFLMLGVCFNNLVETSEKHNAFRHYELAKFVHENSNDNDVIMNGYDKNFNIYRNDASYYWFGLDMLIPVMEQEFGVKNLIDINQVIITQKPKFVYTKNYVDLRALRMYGETKYSQIHIPQIINQLYTETPFNNLVILK